MSDIEFLDLEPAPDGPRPADRRRRIAADPRAIVPVGLWVAAAALAAVAPFQHVYTVTVAVTGGDSLHQTLDGWGRYRGALAAQGPHGGPRYGPAYCAVALLFLAGAAGVLDRPGRRAVVTGAGGFGCGLLAASGWYLLSQYLDVVAIVDRLPATADGRSSHVDLGPAFWLTTAALACGLAALLAGGRHRRGTTGAHPPIG